MPDYGGGVGTGIGGIPGFGGGNVGPGVSYGVPTANQLALQSALNKAANTITNTKGGQMLTGLALSLAGLPPIGTARGMLTAMGAEPQSMAEMDAALEGVSANGPGGGTMGYISPVEARGMGLGKISIGDSIRLSQGLPITINSGGTPTSIINTPNGIQPAPPASTGGTGSTGGFDMGGDYSGAQKIVQLPAPETEDQAKLWDSFMNSFYGTDGQPGYEQRLAEDLAAQKAADEGYLASFGQNSVPLRGMLQQLADRGTNLSEPMGISIGGGEAMPFLSGTQRYAGEQGTNAARELLANKMAEASLLDSLSKTYTPNAAKNQFMDMLNNLNARERGFRYGIPTQNASASTSLPEKDFTTKATDWLNLANTVNNIGGGGFLSDLGSGVSNALSGIGRLFSGGSSGIPETTFLDSAMGLFD